MKIVSVRKYADASERPLGVIDAIHANEVTPFQSFEAVVDEACIILSLVQNNYVLASITAAGRWLGVTHEVTALADDAVQFAFWGLHRDNTNYVNDQHRFAEAEALLRNGWLPGGWAKYKPKKKKGR